MGNGFDASFNLKKDRKSLIVSERERERKKDRGIDWERERDIVSECVIERKNKSREIFNIFERKYKRYIQRWKEVMWEKNKRLESRENWEKTEKKIQRKRKKKRVR